jgi:hypothetical protein
MLPSTSAGTESFSPEGVEPSSSFDLGSSVEPVSSVELVETTSSVYAVRSISATRKASSSDCTRFRRGSQTDS